MTIEAFEAYIPPRAGRCIEIKDQSVKTIENLFLPVRGGVLKLSRNGWLFRYQYSSPCGEVYWNSAEYWRWYRSNIPPRAGRCIEIYQWQLRHSRHIIPPRAGRCIEISISAIIFQKVRFLPVRGGVLKFSVTLLTGILVNSSPCGEVYWNTRATVYNRLATLFLPVRGGVLKLKAMLIWKIAQSFLPVRGGVLKFVLFFCIISSQIPPRAGRCIEI